MIAFTFEAVLTQAGGKPIREFAASVSAPRKLADGNFECRVDCSESEMSQIVTSEYSEQAYHGVLHHVRQALIKREQGVFDRKGRALWFDPPLHYPVAHAGFRGPVRGRWRPTFPAISFSGTIVASDGRRLPYSVRVGSLVYARSNWRHRFWSRVFFTDSFAKLRLAGDWPDEAYCYAFKHARNQLEWYGGSFIDDCGNPIKITAPLLSPEAPSC